jgi:hypothetical protein
VGQAMPMMPRSSFESVPPTGRFEQYHSRCCRSRRMVYTISRKSRGYCNESPKRAFAADSCDSDLDGFVTCWLFWSVLAYGL